TVFCGKLHLYFCAEIASLYLAFSSFSAKYLCGFLLPGGQSTSHARKKADAYIAPAQDEVERL
ncbi:MAG: hypothetical protein WCE73_00480, partial [Candidatus Angelobacter sp.]